ncbi:MAG: isocitrate lyase/PEP mutase family protein [Gammaproteobacteria bacterium]|nr:isocitrate lyase/PEP mutase family protein [Gammaproteobacteria bacterium]
MRTRTERLRQLLAEPGLIVLPGCHDAISARIMERAGFPLAFMSGLAVSAARLAAPDTGLISFGEMLDQGRDICAAVSIPVIGDGDTGYGNAINVKRTVTGYAGAGFAAVMIEDQSLPKRCGFARGVEVVERSEAVTRIRAAVDARDEGADILILGRTDAATIMGIDEGLWRARAYQDAGCDIVYVEGAETTADLEKVAQAITLPKMYVTVEGVPEQKVRARELDRLGFKLMLWAATLLNVSVRAMEEACDAMRAGGHPARIVSWPHLNRVAGLEDYYAEEERYRTAVDGARSEP